MIGKVSSFPASFAITTAAPEILVAVPKKVGTMHLYPSLVFFREPAFAVDATKSEIGCNGIKWTVF